MKSNSLSAIEKGKVSQILDLDKQDFHKILLLSRGAHFWKFNFSDMDICLSSDHGKHELYKM